MTHEPKIFETEATDAGQQTLVPGVRPVTLRDRLEARMAMPMVPRRNPHARQKSCDIGLFDEDARRQLDLLDVLHATKRGASFPTPTEK